MARREYKLFNLSFLDVLSGCLGAILFLFIVVDKGSAPTASPRTTRLVYLDYDSARQQFHQLPDSLTSAALSTSDTVLVVVNRVKALPDCPECLAKKNCPDCDELHCGASASCRLPHCPNPKAHEEGKVGKICPDIHRHEKPDCPDIERHKKPDCDSPDCQKAGSVEVIGDPIAMAYKLGFNLTSTNQSEDVDLQVCFEGKDCVFGGNQKGKFMRWVNLKEGCVFGKPRTWNEMVLAEKSFQPGVYTCYAKLDCKGGGSTNIELVAATKKDNVPQKAVAFRKTLSCGGAWVEVGKVQVGADYSISKK